MDTMLLLTDFSSAARHAAAYSCILAKQLQCKRMILLNTYQTISAVTNVPLEPIAATQLQQESQDKLGELQHAVQEWIGTENISIQTLAQDADLVETANTTADMEQADMIVMGMTEKSAFDKILIGSNTNRLLKSCSHPLLIVPAKAPLEAPGKIVLATDLKEVNKKMSLVTLNNLLQALQARLLVLNVTTGAEHYEANTKEEITDLHLLLDPYKPQYHYTDHPDITEGINAFVVAQQASLLIAIHKVKTGIAGFFSKSISKKLAWHSTVPLLIIPQED